MRGAMILGVMAAAAAAGCSKAHSEDRGPAVDRSYSVGDFDRIELAGAYDTTVHTGAAPSVKAHGSQKVLDRLTVEVRNGVLVIEPKKDSGWHWGNHGRVTLEVTVPSIRGAQLSGAGDIKIDNVKADSFEGGVAGAGDLTIEHAEVGTLKLGVAGAGSARVRSGKTGSAQYEIAGAGDIFADKVTAETASVSIAGAGGVKAHASKTATVSSMGAGDVDVTGGAKCSISKAGAGSVRCS